MRSITIPFAFISFLSCKYSEIKTEFEKSKITDINEIVETIIKEDSLKVSKNEENSRMLCEELTKLDIYVPEKDKNGKTEPPPPPIASVSIMSLIHYGKLGFFSVKDSLN